VKQQQNMAERKKKNMRRGGREKKNKCQVKSVFFMHSCLKCQDEFPISVKMH